MGKNFLLIFIIINSCSYPEMTRDEIIFENDFETNNLQNIHGGNIMAYDNKNILGNYNNDGFEIHIDEIGKHDFIFLSFDLYIHGSWDGNRNGFDTNDKGDIWGIQLKPQMSRYWEGHEKFETTFSNSPCWPNYCLLQSYPDSYPSNNNPQLGHMIKNLPEICTNNFFGGKTTMYKIEKSFLSSGNSIAIRFYDKLYQPNAIDKDGIVQEKCDESWSIDNIEIRAVKYQ